MAAFARQNPFEFGGELTATSLIDREQEAPSRILRRERI